MFIQRNTFSQHLLKVDEPLYKVYHDSTLFGDGTKSSPLRVIGGGGGTSLPDQSGNNGKYLTTNGSTLSWANITIPSGIVTTSDVGTVTNTMLAGSIAGSKLVPNSITAAQLRQSNGTSVMGRAAGTAGNVTDILAVNNGTVLKRESDTLVFGKVTNDEITDATITNAKLVNSTITLNGRTVALGDSINLCLGSNTTVNSSTTSLSLASSDIFSLTMNTSTTLTFANPRLGTYIFRITQDATGGRTITWPANVKWSGGITPTLTTTGGKTDVITLIYDNVNFYGAYMLNF